MTILENLEHIRIALNTLVGLALLGLVVKVYQLAREGKI